MGQKHNIYRYPVGEDGSPTGETDEAGNVLNPEFVEIFEEQLAPAQTLFGHLSELRYYNPGYQYYSVIILDAEP